MKELVNEKLNAGRYNVVFDASSLNSGMYIYKMETADKVATRKMMLVK